MKRIITTIILSILAVNSFAEEKKTTMQVSATIKPYCRLVVEKDSVKHVCPGYKTEEVIRSTTTKDEQKDSTTITITY